MATTCSAPSRASSTTRTASMVAPLPPNQRCRGSHPRKAPASSATIATSEVIVESLLGAAEPQHGPERRRLLRRQPHHRAGALPEGALAGEHVVHLIRL